MVKISVSTKGENQLKLSISVLVSNSIESKHTDRWKNIQLEEMRLKSLCFIS